MKTKTIFKALAMAMLMPAMLLTTACSNDDFTANNDNNVTTAKQGYTLPVTVNVTREGDATMRATYTDNGNGTFSEHPVTTPVYRTEYYDEPEQEPVYRSEPVYQTKYYYDIDRWVEVQTYETSGNDHDPYWSSEYTLAANQRDTMRSEEYYTIYNDTDIENNSYDRWAAQEIGDGIYVTRNRLGMEYSRKEK